MFVGQVFQKLLARRLTLAEGEIQGCANGSHQRLRRGQRCQGDKIDAVGKTLQQIGPGLQAEACFAHPAHAQDGHQAGRGVFQQAVQLGQLGLTSHEGGGVGGQVMAGGAGLGRRGKARRLWQAGGAARLLRLPQSFQLSARQANAGDAPGQILI